MKTVAVITDALSAEFFFPLWHDYYGGLFGARNLHVVTYQGLKPAFADIALGNLWEVDAAYDDALRAAIMSDLVAALLRCRDVVIRADVDEFLLPDPKRYRDLAEFIARCDLPYVTAQGIDIIARADEAPLDLTQPVFGVQRGYGLRSAALNKTCVTTEPLRWGGGFHGASVPPRFAGLYLLHLKFADLERRTAWDETVRQQLEPGSKAHDYFSTGADHLASVQNAFAALPVGGQETQDQFDARYLETVALHDATGIYAGTFLRQDFLIPLSALGLAPPAMVSVEELQAFDGRTLTDPAPGLGFVQTIEAPQSLPPPVPAMCADLSGTNAGARADGALLLRGTDLHVLENVMLIGPNMLVGADGQWSCAMPRQAGAMLRYLQHPSFAARFPGARPGLVPVPGGTRLEMAGLAREDVTVLSEPVFLATLPAPHDWGQWLLHMPAVLAQFRKFGKGRKFLCAVANERERQLLRKLGLTEEALLAHDPGRTYLCRDVMTLCYSGDAMTVSAAERALTFEILATTPPRGPRPRRLFIPRAAPRPGAQAARGLRNAGELTGALEAQGFAVFEPQPLPLDEQLSLFAAAEEVVFLDAEAVQYALFCPPGAQAVLAGPREELARPARLLASLGMRYAEIWGARADAAPGQEGQGWTLDIDRAGPLIARFFRGA